MTYSDYQIETNQFFENLLLLGSQLGFEYIQKGQVYLNSLITKSIQMNHIHNEMCIMPLDAEYARDPEYLAFKNSEFCKLLVSERQGAYESPLYDEAYSFYCYKLFLSSFFYNDLEKSVVFPNSDLADKLLDVLKPTRSTYGLQMAYQNKFKVGNYFNHFPQNNSSGLSVVGAIPRFSSLWQTIFSSPTPNENQNVNPHI